MRDAFQKNYKFVAGQTSPEDALGNNNYPATASYIDVSGYEWVEVIIHLGFIHASDTPTFEVFQTNGVSGSLTTLDATNCKKVCAHTDDDQMLTFYIETATLADDHHFLSTTCTLSTNGSYADIIYLLGGARHMPITQDTTMMPSDNQLMRAG